MAAQGRVIIAPTRGSNMPGAVIAAARVGVIIAPTRGSNQDVCGPRQHDQPVIIAPTRGSNSPRSPLRAWRPSPVIIAPTRGSNSRCPASCRCGRSGHHRPYEGQQPAAAEPERHPGMRGHHRPYEGQQPDQQGPRAHGYQVIIAPTRGSNMSARLALLAVNHVIIAPTRGSNVLIQLT